MLGKRSQWSAFSVVCRHLLWIYVAVAVVPEISRGQDADIIQQTAQKFLKSLESRRGIPEDARPWSKVSPLPTWLSARAEEASAQEEYRAALRKKISVEFKAIPLLEVLKWLEQEIDAPFYVNVPELDLLGVDPQTPITIRAHTGAAEHVLALILDPLELTYIERQLAIEITSKDAGSSDPVNRYYDMAWILNDRSEVADLVNAIELTIHPDSWINAGGTSNLQVIGSVLIVNAPSATQRRVEAMFGNLLRLKNSSSLSTNAQIQFRNPSSALSHHSPVTAKATTNEE